MDKQWGAGSEKGRVNECSLLASWFGRLVVGNAAGKNSYLVTRVSSGTNVWHDQSGSTRAGQHC